MNQADKTVLPGWLIINHQQKIHDACVDWDTKFQEPLEVGKACVSVSDNDCRTFRVILRDRKTKPMIMRVCDAHTDTDLSFSW